MKKAAAIALVTVAVISSSISILTGCDNNSNTGKSNETAIKDVVEPNITEINKVINKGDNAKSEFEAYAGPWKLKISGDEELYLITSLEDYFGRTAIDIESVSGKKVKGSISSVQGAPSYRQASVDFEGEIDNDILTTNYKDDNWLYSGNMELTFKGKEIAANISRDKTENIPMWGIPEGKHIFVRPIETTKVEMSEKEKRNLEKFLSPLSNDIIEPFAKEGLTDENIIRFVGINLAAGFLNAS
ncbi:MAG: hypothetical protein HY779_01255, partial [Rubrobacteridae bacterium]|nr:hypothetical protein [Rubrobacteridae bacterium]